jgi:hypothetical protein
LSRCAEWATLALSYEFYRDNFLSYNGLMLYGRSAQFTLAATGQGTVQDKGMDREDEICEGYSRMEKSCMKQQPEVGHVSGILTLHYKMDVPRQQKLFQQLTAVVVVQKWKKSLLETA